MIHGRHRSLVTLLVVSAIPCGAQAQSVVSGMVRDTAGKPIPGASVSIAGTANRASTNEQGRFRLSHGEADSAHLVVLRIGYARYQQRLDSLPIDAHGGEVAITLRAVPVTIAGPTGPRRPLDIRDDTVPDRNLDEVVRAAKLPLLRKAGRTRAEREVRLALLGGIGVPGHLAVLRARGRRVTGEVWLAWGPRPDDSMAPEEDSLWRKHAAEFGCPRARWMRTTHTTEYGERERTSTLVCRATFREPPDWEAFWRRLDSLEVWTLPDAGELPGGGPVLMDGITLVVEMFDGERYRIIRHGNPDANPSPEAARAAAMIRLLDPVLRSVEFRESPGEKR